MSRVKGFIAALIFGILFSTVGYTQEVRSPIEMRDKMVTCGDTKVFQMIFDRIGITPILGTKNVYDSTSSVSSSTIIVYGKEDRIVIAEILPEGKTCILTDSFTVFFNEAIIKETFLRGKENPS